MEHWLEWEIVTDQYHLLDYMVLNLTAIQL